MTATDDTARAGSDPAAGPEGVQQPPVPAPAAPPDLTELAELVVNGVFRIGLTLHAAASITDGPARDRLQCATEELDRLIGDVRTAVFTGGPPAPAATTDGTNALADAVATVTSPDSVLAAVDAVAHLAVQLGVCDHAAVAVVSPTNTIMGGCDTGRRLHALRADRGNGPDGAVGRSDVTVIDDLLAGTRSSKQRDAFVAAGVRSALWLVAPGPAASAVHVSLYARHARRFRHTPAEVPALLAATAAYAVSAGRGWERAGQLEQALGSRDVIGQAKGILMARRHLTPAAAFEALRAASQRFNIKLQALAEQVATTGADPEQLDRLPFGRVPTER